MQVHRDSTLDLELLETRTLLDASAVFGPQFVASEFVKENADGTLRFASLQVGAALDADGPPGSTALLDDSDIVNVRGRDLSIARVKAYLHGFADSLGTDSIIETKDILFSSWGNGSGSTSRQFEDFMQSQMGQFEACNGLQFSEAVRFELPGEGGEFFTGGFLDISVDGGGGLLRGGDIAEVIDSYEISVDLTGSQLIVEAMLGPMHFVINSDKTLTDEFGRTWTPTEGSVVAISSDAADRVLGDIDGNGLVEFADFLILSSNYGKETDEGDLNGDAVVNFADFLILADNYGK